MQNNGRIFLGIITAAAAGAVIGMLFAPEKGDDFRKKIGGSLNEWADELLKAVQQGQTEFNKGKDNLMNQAEHLKNQAKNKVEGYKDEAQNAMNNAKDKVREQI